VADSREKRRVGEGPRVVERVFPDALLVFDGAAEVEAVRLVGGARLVL